MIAKNFIMINRTLLLKAIFPFIALLTFSCDNITPSILEQAVVLDSISEIINTSPNDSIAIMHAFETIKSDKKFIKSLGWDGEDQFYWNDDLIKIFRGDLDGDGSEDALVFFTIEGGDLGNNWYAHYAAFLKKDNKWNYIDQIKAGGNWNDRFILVHQIKNGKISGNSVGNKDESLPEIPVEYILKSGKILNTFTGLHKEENDKREYLSIDLILTSENISIPILGTLKEYQKLLGKGKITTPEEQPECGTFFDEGPVRYLEYSNMKFELTLEDKAAWITVEIPNSGMRVQTDKGTITEKTTMAELKSIFYRTDSWGTTEMDKETQLFIIPDGMESDDQLHILFDKNGKLLRVTLFVQC